MVTTVSNWRGTDVVSFTLCTTACITSSVCTFTCRINFLLDKIFICWAKDWRSYLLSTLHAFSVAPDLAFSEAFPMWTRCMISTGRCSTSQSCFGFRSTPPTFRGSARYSRMCRCFRLDVERQLEYRLWGLCMALKT